MISSMKSFILDKYGTTFVIGSLESKVANLLDLKKMACLERWVMKQNQDLEISCFHFEIKGQRREKEQKFQYLYKRGGCHAIMIGLR